MWFQNAWWPTRPVSERCTDLHHWKTASFGTKSLPCTTTYVNSRSPTLSTATSRANSDAIKIDIFVHQTMANKMQSFLYYWAFIYLSLVKLELATCLESTSSNTLSSMASCVLYFTYRDATQTTVYRRPSTRELRSPVTFHPLSQQLICQRVPTHSPVPDRFFNAMRTYDGIQSQNVCTHFPNSLTSKKTSANLTLDLLSCFIIVTRHQFQPPSASMESKSAAPWFDAGWKNGIAADNH